MRYFNKASRDYEFIEKYDAGIALTGSDAKSLRQQPPQYTNSRIEIIEGQPIIFSLKIPKYKYSQETVDTTSQRNLLLSEKEMLDFSARKSSTLNPIL
jgi:SsrA-binding protein